MCGCCKSGRSYLSNFHQNQETMVFCCSKSVLDTASVSMSLIACIIHPNQKAIYVLVIQVNIGRLGLFKSMM